MDRTIRQAIAVGLGLAFIWQASQDPSRAFGAILLAAAVLYAFSPGGSLRRGVTVAAVPSGDPIDKDN